MDKKTEGAWIIHHANKLQLVAGAIEFQELDFAGKCGSLLSALAADKECILSKPRVEAIAKANRLNVHTDLPAIINKLADQQLIDQSTNEIAVLGLTTSVVLSHTADIFASTNPTDKEQAVIAIAEETSRSPVIEKDLGSWVEDVFKLSKEQSCGLLNSAADIGFVDVESVDNSSKVYFNGNLFRIDNAKKCEAILNSLSGSDRSKMQEVEDILTRKGCLEDGEVKKILGEILFSKLQSIGIFDVNAVNNDKETVYYVTRPGAFGKFGNTIAADALDLAKAFVASLTYGINKSIDARGKIRLLNHLLDKLIRGETLNPSTAAGQDYRVLEMKGVIETTHVRNGMFTMRLLKKEVGVHAKQILNFGDVSEASLPTVPGASIIAYVGPEENRSNKRKRMAQVDKSASAALLQQIRTGALKR